MCKPNARDRQVRARLLARRVISARGLERPRPLALVKISRGCAYVSDRWINRSNKVCLFLVQALITVCFVCVLFAWSWAQTLSPNSPRPAAGLAPRQIKRYARELGRAFSRETKPNNSVSFSFSLEVPKIQSNKMKRNQMK